ncbi:hypothetical protein PQR66_09500 [Paraburkholderia agricolaris]|uniref:Uncharacterized protein n=1 Tax=Paraburkholderia agricolaris TaxID=2152888 RepID=A0ABW8ZMG4_9BURK
MSIPYWRMQVKVCLLVGVVLAVVYPERGSAREILPLCSSVLDALKREAKLREVATAVFGPNPAYVQDDDLTRACVFPVAALEYPDARVLIVGSVPGALYPITEARLSAFFLRPMSGTLRLVTVRRDFASSGSGMGNVGKITAIHFGDDEGIMIAADSNGQGYDQGSVAFYLFRKEGIVSLGTIPTSFSDGGAVDDPGKETHVDGNVEVGKPRADLIRVVYSIRRNGKTRQQPVIWGPKNGKFVPVSGAIPKELNR